VSKEEEKVTEKIVIGTLKWITQNSQEANKDKLILAKMYHNIFMDHVQYLCNFVVKKFTDSKFDAISKIKSFFNSLSNESRNQANSKRSNKQASHEVKNLMNAIYEPDRSTFAHLFNEDKEFNVQNLCLMNVLKFLVTVEMVRFTSDSAYVYDADKIKEARETIE
jgi:hypothetical protein